MAITTTTFAAILTASLLLPAVALPIKAFAQTETPVGGPSAAAKPKPPIAKPMSGPERVEQRITHLHTQLRITPAQQSQWDQFARVMRENSNDMYQTLEQRGTGFKSMNAAENMQSYAKIARQHAEDTQKLATTFQALYGTMPDEQKKNADTVFRARGEHHGHIKK